MTQHGFQCPRQLGSGAFQFRTVRQCELAQYRPARRRQPDPYFAFILFPRMPRHRARLLQAVYQFHRAVVLNEQSRGEFADRRFGAFRKTMLDVEMPSGSVGRVLYEMFQPDRVTTPARK